MAPPPTKVTAGSAGTGVSQLTITACDPGADQPTNNGLQHLTLGAAPLRAEQYRELLMAQPQLRPTQAACVLYGNDPVSLTDERGPSETITSLMAKR